MTPYPILAIDPGSTVSGWVLYHPGHDRPIVNHGIDPNPSVVGMLRQHASALMPYVVIEWTAPRGMPASAELFETMWWAGRFAEAADQSGAVVDRVERKAVGRFLCGVQSARDSNIRQALIDLFGGVAGKDAAIGRKASPGPLYGISSHVWAALGVAVTYADTLATATGQGS